MGTQAKKQDRRLKTIKSAMGMEVGWRKKVSICFILFLLSSLGFAPGFWKSAVPPTEHQLTGWELFVNKFLNGPHFG